MPKRFFGLIVSFVVGVLLTLSIPCFFSKVEFAFLIPPLVMSFYFVSQKNAFWLALGCGLFLDAVNVMPRFAFLGSTYLATTLILYPFRLYFFKDAFSTLAIMTYLFSSLASCIQALTALLLDLPFPFTLSWFFCDCLIMPLLDALYAIAIFSLPHFLYSYYYKRKQRSHNYAS